MLIIINQTDLYNECEALLKVRLEFLNVTSHFTDPTPIFPVNEQQ